MADQQANVSSLEALESFRSGLIVFLSKSKSSLGEISDDVRRTRSWLEGEQRNHWQTQIKLRRRKLDEAQQELFSAKLATFTSATTLQEAAVQRARRSMNEAEDKLRMIKTCLRNFDSQVEPLARKLDNLQQYLGNDMPKAVAFLTQIQKTLESYAELSKPGAAPPTSDSAGTES